MVFLLMLIFLCLFRSLVIVVIVFGLNGYMLMCFFVCIIERRGLLWCMRVGML